MNGSIFRRVRAVLAAAAMAFSAIATAQLSPPSIGGLGSLPFEVGGIGSGSIPIGNSSSTDVLTGVNIELTLPPGLTGYGSGSFSRPAGSCGTVVVGPSSITVTGGSLPTSIDSGGQCVLFFSVNASTSGYYSVDYSVTTTQTGTQTGSRSFLIAFVPAEVTPSFSPDRLGPGGSTTLTITLANPDPNMRLFLYGFIPLGSLSASVVSHTCLSTDGGFVIDPQLNELFVPYLSFNDPQVQSSCDVVLSVVAPATPGIYPVPSQPTTLTGSMGPLAPLDVADFSVNPTVQQTNLAVVGAELTVSPLLVNFPQTLVGSTSASVPLSVTNTGFLPLSFSSLSISPRFSYSTDCLAQLLAVGASCNLSVAFSPTSTALQTGSLSITSDGGSATVSLSGSGGVSPVGTSWTFNPASVIAGTRSILALTISNPHGAAFSSSGLSYTLPPLLVVPASPTVNNPLAPCAGTLVPATDGLSFTVSGLTVPANASCSFGVDVTSTTPGTYTVIMEPDTIVGTVLFQPGVTNAGSAPASLVVSPVPAPVLALSPAPPGPIDFGTVTLGSFSATTVTLTNAGNAPLSFSGAPSVAPPFVVNMATALPCPATLPAAPGPGNFCTVEVKFEPTAVGTATGAVSFASDGGSGTLDLVGSGTAAPVPAISLNPTSLTFASQAIGTTSGPLQVTLTNSGVAPLAISSFASGGDFAHSSACPLAPSTLAASASCTITVTFSPLITGDRIGTLSVSSNAAQGAGVVSLFGTGVAVPVPAVTVLPGSLSFPLTQVGTASSPASVQVTNSGGAPLSVTSVQIVGGGFGVTSDGCTGTIAVGSNCTVTVVFTPPVEGSLGATLQIVSNAPASPAQVALSGRGSFAPLATLSVSPGSLAFAEQTIGSASHAQTVTLTNTGTATATVSGLTVTGDYAQTNNCASVPADGSCTISVTFTPTGSGPRPGSIVISANASNAPITVALSGSGVPPPLPVIELSVSSLSYGNTMIGRGTAGQAFTLRNAGGVPLTITGMSVPAEFPVSSGCNAVVPAGESCRIDVGFLPKVSGPRAGRLDITSDASNGTVGVDLSGTGCRFTFLGRNPALICQ